MKNKPMKKILALFVIIPNLPFIAAVSAYVWFNVIRHTPLIELEMTDDPVTPEIKKHIAQIYPVWFQRALAVAFYALVVFLSF